MLGHFQTLVQFIPTYALILVFVLAPLLIVIVVWRLMDFLVNRLGDRAIHAHQSKRRFKKMGDNKTREELLHSLRTLDPKEFEHYMASVFVNAGFKTKVVGGHGEGDGGIDIILDKDGSVSFVQCKKFIGRGIGVAEVRDFYGAIADQLHADSKSKGYFVTTTFFTEAAQKFAKDKRLRLHDGDGLLDIIYRQEGLGDKVGLADKERSILLRSVPPICPVCRRSLVRRQKDQSVFIGCTGYPACRYTFSINVKIN